MLQWWLRVDPRAPPPLLPIADHYIREACPSASDIITELDPFFTVVVHC